MRRRTPLAIDVYAILQVAPMATAAEIKRSYRRLAHEWHPDVSVRGNAEEQIKLLNAAYDVLKDPAQRAEYDLAHPLRVQSPPPAPRPRGSEPSVRPVPTPPAKLDVHAQVELTYAEAISGAVKRIPFRRRIDCTGCTGPVDASECRNCRGLRWTETSDWYDWKIPPGATGETTIRVPRAGDRLAGRVGDLYLRVALLKQPGITRKGADFHVEQRVRSVTLVRGGRIAVEGPSGKMSVVVPPGTKSGTVLRLGGAGLPYDGGRGSIHVRLWEEHA